MSVLLLVGFIVFFSLDFHYLWRVALVTVFCTVHRKFRPKKILEKNTHFGICLPTDLDHMGHMNNARYLRECDFGRIEFWIENFGFDYISSKGGSLTNGGNNIRYRRSLNLFQKFRIETRIVYWDTEAFYMEQCIIRKSDDFICAINMVKQTCIGVSPEDVMRVLVGEDMEKPTILPEVDTWVQSMRHSSERLRKAA